MPKRIKIQVAKLANERGIKTAYQLQKALNISPSMAARLWKGNFKMITIATIEKLCGLLGCEPSDLLKLK